MDTKLGWPTWIGVVVEDLAAATRFWGDLLGLPVDHEGDHSVMFRFPDGRWFELIERSDEPEYDARRFQVGFEVEDIERAVAGLRERGLEPFDEPDLEYEESWAYFRDPEGNVFEVKQRARPSEPSR